jgi:hypothetical protein
MAIQSVVIKVGGVPQVVTFDNLLQAYVATVPLQLVDFYEVEVDATDAALTTTTLITFLSTAQGEVVKFSVLSSTNTPVAGVNILAYYRNPVGGANYGRAELQTTDKNGEAYLHLNAGNYNISISSPGFSSKVINNFQVISGINVYDNGTGTIPNTHVVRDQDGNPVESVSVKIEDLTLDANVRLVAHRKTSPLGSWSAMFPSGHPLAITFEKPGLDMQKVGVQSA